MDSSLYKIIKTLIENGPTTTDELAYLEDVGNRTIQNRINDLSLILQDTATINKYGNTYSLAIHKYDEFLKIETQFLKGELDLNDAVVREMTILNSLIIRRDYVSIDQISDEIGLDKRQINQTLFRLKEKLSYYTAVIINKRGKGIRLIFNNDSYLLLLLRNIYQTNRKYVDSDLFRKNNDLLKEIHIDKKVKSNIVLNMTVLSKARENHGSFNAAVPNFYPLWNEKDNNIGKLISRIKNQFTDLTNSELNFILSPINLCRNDYLDIDKLNKVFKVNRKIISNSLRDSMIHFGLNEDDIYDRIKWHILFLINRCILHISVKQNLSKNISERYPVAFEFAWSLSQIIETKYDVKVSINEINYLVLYFEMVMKPLSDKTNEGVSIALIGNYRLSVKKFIIAQLQNVFPNINIDIVKSKNDLSKDKNYLLILTQKLFEYGSIPVINTNVLFRENAFSIISLFALVQRYIDEGKVKIIKYDLFKSTYYDLVQELVNKLVDNGELTSDFYNCWVKREKKSNNVISNGIAIPHAVDGSGKSRVFLALGVVKNKVTYNRTNLKLIFLIGIPQELDNSLIEANSRVYDLILTISQNQILFENVKNFDNHRAFIQMLEGI